MAHLSFAQIQAQGRPFSHLSVEELATLERDIKSHIARERDQGLTDWQSYVATYEANLDLITAEFAARAVPEEGY